MALTVNMMFVLRNIIKPEMRIASFGYPDLIAPMEMLLPMLAGDASRLDYRADSQIICKRHGLQERQIPDAESFFSLMGCTLHVYDIVRERGCEIICDLNRRLDPALRAFNYDIVLDVGTIEHCFNIAQAAMNMASMVKCEGFIFHENPFCQGNHGFYGLNPTWYADFYAANGFKVLDLRLVTMDGRSANAPATKRFKAFGEECNVFALAQRVEDKPFVFPVQSKYAKLIPAAGDSGEKKKET